MIYSIGMTVYENNSGSGRGNTIAYTKDIQSAILIKIALERLNQPYQSSSIGTDTLSYKIVYSISPHHGDVKDAY